MSVQEVERVRITDADNALGDFGFALAWMKGGRRVARVGWNGKGMWVCLAIGKEQLHVSHVWDPNVAKFARTRENAVITVLPYFVMKTADDKILMGWLASQSDLCAHDWQVLPETEG